MYSFQSTCSISSTRPYCIVRKHALSLEKYNTNIFIRIYHKIISLAMLLAYLQLRLLKAIGSDELAVDSVSQARNGMIGKCLC